MARNMMKRPKTLYAILTGDTTYEDAEGENMTIEARMAKRAKRQAAAAGRARRALIVAMRAMYEAGVELPPGMWTGLENVHKVEIAWLAEWKG